MLMISIEINRDKKHGHYAFKVKIIKFILVILVFLKMLLTEYHVKKKVPMNTKLFNYY